MTLGRTVVVGGGRMGEAIVAGWIRAGARDADSITVAEPDAARCAALEAAYCVTCIDSAVTAVADADLVVLAVKPQVMDTVVADFASALPEGALVVSIAAGIPTARLEALLPAGTAVVRVMPNTPALVGEGMSVVSGGATATERHTETVRRLFAALGDAVVLPEPLQDAATAVSGSGPAYFARFAAVLADAGQAAGLPRETALALVVQTMRGTAALLADGTMAPEALVAAVSSPGGTTVAALGVLDERGFDETVAAAVAAAIARAMELGS